MILLVIGYVLILLVDLGPLLRWRKWADVATWLTIFALAATITIFQQMAIEFPSAMLFLGDLLKAVGLSY